MFSSTLITALHTVSNGVANDMDEGSDDVECVTEATIDALSAHDRSAYAEWQLACRVHGSVVAFTEACKHVYPL